MQPSIVWLRNDLRLADNPALRAAVDRGAPVIAVFIWSPEEEGNWAPGAAGLSWLHRSLESFQQDCSSIGLRLVLKSGPPLDVLKEVVDETGAGAVFWNRRYEPLGIACDTRVKAGLKKEGVEVESFPGNVLFEPWDIKNQEGKPYKVFTPFWKACLKKGRPPAPLPKVTKAGKRAPECSSLELEDLGLLPVEDWDKKIFNKWQVGEKAAKRRLLAFLNDKILDYKKERDFPGKEGVSRMSPHLHFGEISPGIIWEEAHKRHSGREEGVKCYLSEIGWREFAHHLLFHFPRTPDRPLYKKFEAFKWRNAKKDLKAWQSGMTGYPIVDAGMRQLWETGWMHNRVRMIVGSFLVKDLLISWKKGAEWFWDTLVDADLANNTLGWQWVGGCGADAAPYFRIFNPITQGERFDPDGDYVRKWVPELKKIPKKWIHHPWDAPEEELKGLVLGDDYPVPIVDHKEARDRALEAFSFLST